MEDAVSTKHEQLETGLSKEMWYLLVIFAFLVLTNGIFILAMIFLGPANAFLILIGFAISHITFFILMILGAVYYTRRKP